MGNANFRGVAAGEQLGNLEYVVDDCVIAEYRALVGDCATYANLIADDCQSMALARFGDTHLTTVWRRFEFLRPPIPGRRVQAGGWLREVRESGGLPWLRVSAFAVDEIGAEILRSESAFVVGAPDSQPRLSAAVRRSAPSLRAECDFTAQVGDLLPLGEWDSPDCERLRAYQKLRRELSGAPRPADEYGDTQLLAGWLEGQVGRYLGKDFRWGGQLSLVYRAAAGAGERITADAAVVANDTDHNGTRSVRLIVGAYNEGNQTIAVGEASATMPSPRLL